MQMIKLRTITSDELNDISEARKTGGTYMGIINPWPRPVRRPWDNDDNKTVSWPPQDLEDRIARSLKNKAPDFPVDLYQDDQQLVIVADLPGYSQDSISIEIDNEDVITISASRPMPERQFISAERKTGTHSRRVEVSDKVDFSNAEAKYEEGVLTITIPKSPEAKNRIIPIKK